tara:strand:- start:1056 stop:1442 length:387 start_codon:yes stop_codon:yes gene_type:complete
MELGTRWLHQGRASRKGLDCLGLIVLTARRCGYDVEDTTNYMANPDSELLIREVTRQFDLIDLEEATTGDVLTFAFTETRRPYHFAIMTSPTTMIHAYGTARKVIEHTIDEYWNGCKVHAFRFPGVTA